MEVIWNLEAKNTFAENIEFLKGRWTIKEIDTFIDKTEQLLKLLKKNPELGQFDEDWQAYKFLVVPQIYMFYEIQGNKLVLLYFWNNYKKPLF